MFRVTPSNQSAFAKNIQIRWILMRCTLEGDTAATVLGREGGSEGGPLCAQKTARYINFPPLPSPLPHPGEIQELHLMFRLLCCSELGNLNKLFQIKKKKKNPECSARVHFVRNYIFAGKVNFEGSLNDCRGMEVEWKREREWGEREKKNKKNGRGVQDCDAPTRSIGRHGGEGGERAMQGGRQLLKAIALPPGCLRRAESVEMLNLAWHPSWIIVGVGANQRKMSSQFKSCQLVKIRPSCPGHH